MGTQQRASVIDWSVLSRIVGENDALRARLLQSFVTESGRDLSKLEAALDEQKFDAARMVAHQLSGAARMVGAISLADAARALEGDAPYREPAQIAARRAALRDELTRVHERIHALER